MSQNRLFGLEPRVWAVSDLNRHLRHLLESDYRLQDLWVAGEVSNLSRPASGHLYFTLKDARASLRCVMWRTDVRHLGVMPDEGDAIEAHGRISLYEEGGQYQLYVDTLSRAGEGALHQAFQRLKTRLDAEGLFDPEHKRPLPVWPARIGLVTSPTGAALSDVIKVLQRRYPLAEVVLSPTRVQGAGASGDIMTALQMLLQFARPDVILMVRGGGSIEDLSAFNDESLARAIHESQVPIVTGIGHEIDFTIADFVADQRAPTPSAAAEIATPDMARMSALLRDRRRELGRSFAGHLQRLRWQLERRRSELMRLSPRAVVAAAGQRVDDLSRRGSTAIQNDLALKRESLARLLQTLHAVGPQAVLERGYAMVRRMEDGRLLRSIEQVAAGDRMEVRLHDGTFEAEAIEARDE